MASTAPIPVECDGQPAVPAVRARRAYRKGARVGCIRCLGLNPQGRGFRPLEMSETCPCWYTRAFYAALHAYRSAWKPRSRPPSYSCIDYAVDFERQARDCGRELGGIHPVVLDRLVLRQGDCAQVALELDVDTAWVYAALRRIKQELGRRLCRLEPYPLYPVTGYLRPVGGTGWNRLARRSQTGIWKLMECTRSSPYENDQPPR